MYEIQVANSSINECFKWRGRYPLENPRPQQTLVALRHAAPDTRTHDKDGPEDEKMALA